MQLDISPGSEYLLPFAKKMFNGLVDLPSRFTYVTADQSIFVRANPPLIRIRGEPTTGAYLFESNVGILTSKVPRRFQISSPGGAIPAANRVTPVGLTDLGLSPLGTSLTFHVHSGDAVGNVLTTGPRRVLRLFGALMRRGNAYARVLWNQLTFSVNRTLVSPYPDPDDEESLITTENVPTTVADCMFSEPDASGDFWVLLGQWVTTEDPARDAAVELDPTYTEDYLPPIPQHFEGLAVRFSELLASVVTVGSTFNFVLNEYSAPGTAKPLSDEYTSAAVTTVRVVNTDVERNKPIFQGGPFEPDTGFLEDLRWTSFQTACPTRADQFTTSFFATYPDSLDPWAREESGHTFTINPTDGTLVKSTLVFPALAPTSWTLETIDGSHTNTFTGWNTGVFIYSTSGFHEVGNYNIDAKTSDLGLYTTGAWLGALPTVEGATTFLPAITEAYLHLPEFDAYLTPGGLEDAGDLAAYANSSTPPSSIDQLHTPGLAEYHPGIVANMTVSSAPGVRDQVVSGGFPMLNSNPSFSSSPQGTGIPTLISTTGTLVYFYRDGETGLLSFDTTYADAADETLAATQRLKYQQIALGALLPTDPSYEDPATLLAAILARITVIVNNFASDSLFPWLDSGKAYVIL